jgi:retron-type reverse transcriptase
MLLTQLDRELEKRGHSFCRFADDCNTYVKSKEAGMRVKQGITRFLTERLKRLVNEARSTVDRPWNQEIPRLLRHV